MPMERIDGSQNSSNSHDYPWPNDSTTISDSDLIASQVLFDDVDNNTYEDAIFFSKSSDIQSASKSAPVIRVVQSGNFKELQNINSLSTAPDLSEEMLLVDVDLNESEKELIYLSQDRSRIVAMNLAGADLGQEKFNHPVVEPLHPTQEVAFSVRSMAGRKQIQLGKNIIVLDSIAGNWIESADSTTDGGWGNWYDWNTCSKTCGDGFEARIRICANPVPRNGGAQCTDANNSYREGLCAQGDLTQCGVQGVETRSCRIRACVATDCDQYQLFNASTGNCDEDPDNPRPNTSTGTNGQGGQVTGGTGTTPGGSNGGVGPTDGPGQPGSCPSGKVWDPFYFKCFKPYPVNNIMLSHTTYEWIGESRDREMVRRVHTHRLGLSHRLARGMTHRATAAEYCRFRGYDDVMSYATAIQDVIQSTPARYQRVFVLCNIATNGMYYNQGGCPVGNYMVSFNYTNSTHAVGTSYTYLKSVVCRRND